MGREVAPRRALVLADFEKAGVLAALFGGIRRSAASASTHSGGPQVATLLLGSAVGRGTQGLSPADYIEDPKTQFRTKMNGEQQTSKAS